MNKFTTFIWETVKMVVISLAIILPIRYFLVEPFYVKGASMEPNFHDFEYLIIDRLTYRYEAPVRGEVVVFKYPRNPQEYYIKRVIGLPGETVEIKDNSVYIYNTANPNGFKLTENYLPTGIKTEVLNPQFTRTELRADEYFVMGDNRGASQDSRYFGPVAKGFFTGHVVLRGLPVDRFGTIPTPSY